MKKTYFKNLDSLRFIAAMMVFLEHALRNKLVAFKSDNFFLKLLISLCDGEIGVSLFFVLSGFLITYLLIEEHNDNFKIDLKKFYLKRVLRIWPLYYLVVLISSIIYPIIEGFIGTPNEHELSFMCQIVFLSNFD